MNEQRVISYRQYYQMYPTEFQPGDIIDAHVVLVMGYANDYSIYVADAVNQDANEIAQWGDKVCGQVLHGGELIDRQEAIGKGLFPSAVAGRHARR